MSWNDKPSEAQLGIIYKWLRWEMPNSKASEAVNWLEDHATRKEVSLEMDRLKKLRDSRRITKESCFDSAVWKGYSCDI